MTTLKSNANDMINNNAADNVMSAAELQEAAAVQADAPARESVKEEKILEEMKEKRGTEEIFETKVVENFIKNNIRHQTTDVGSTEKNR